MASEISRLIDQFLRETVDPIATAEGFRKTKRFYRRYVSGRVEVFSFEARSWNTALRGEFDVGLGVVDPEIAAIRQGKAVDLTKATGHEGGCYRVLGHLLTPPQNKQWVVAPDTDWSEEAQHLQKAFLSVALPWFSKSRSNDGFIELLQDDPSMAAREALAVCFAKAGNLDRAKSEIDEILRRRPDLQWRTRELMARATHG